MTAEQLADAMQLVWDDWCADTGCVPADFTVHGPSTTRVEADFHRGSFARLVLERFETR